MNIQKEEEEKERLRDCQDFLTMNCLTSHPVLSVDLKKEEE